MNSFEGPASTLAEIEGIRERTRTSLHSVWYPLVVWGAASLGAAAVAGLDTRLYAVYWLAAIVACIVAVNRYYAARAQRVGVANAVAGRRYARLWIAFFPILLVAGSVADAIGGTPASLAAETTVLAALYVVIARWEQSRIMAVLAAVVLAIGVALAASDPAHLVALANLTLGAALLTAGLYALGREESP